MEIILRISLGIEDQLFLEKRVLIVGDIEDGSRGLFEEAEGLSLLSGWFT